MSTLQHRRNKRNRNRAIRGQELAQAKPWSEFVALARAAHEATMHIQFRLELITKIGAATSYVQYSPKT